MKIWRTLQVGTEEAADMQFETHRTTHPGEIGDSSDIPRVNLCGTVMAEGAYGLFSSRCHHNGNGRLGGIKELQMEARACVNMV